MLWDKKKIIGFGIFALVFCSALSSSVCFAINDVVYDLSSSDTYPYQICYFSSSQGTPLCSDFKYIIIDPVYSITPTSANNSYFTFSGLYGARILSFTTTIIELKSPIDSIVLNSWPSVLSSVEITLTDKDFSFGSVSGSLSITENGTYNVTNYSEAVVDIPPEVVEGDYHDDLVNIYHAIIICAGVVLVLYFFYCIYRVFIKTVGGL